MWKKKKSVYSFLCVLVFFREYVYGGSPSLKMLVIYGREGTCQRLFLPRISSAYISSSLFPIPFFSSLSFFSFFFLTFEKYIEYVNLRKTCALRGHPSYVALARSYRCTHIHMVNEYVVRVPL